MLNLAILGLLSEQDLHGYELRKRLAELPVKRLSVSFGSIYPALAKLERAGMVKAVTQVSVPVPTAPMSGSLAGELAAFRANRSSLGSNEGKRGARGKKVYGLTDRGREQLHELLTTTDAGDRDFPVLVAFCHQLRPAERLELFERRRQDLVSRRGQGQPSTQLSERVNRYLRSLNDHDTEVADADLAWIDRLIAAERAGLGEALPKPQGEDQP
jgi:DNA-binding PadR family transcriptional regulator